MGLIKSSAAPTDPAPFSMRDIEQQARTMLLRAQQQADQILAATQREGEQLKELARIAGFEEGKAAGFAEGLAQGTKLGQQEALDHAAAELKSCITTLQTGAELLDQSMHRLQIEAKNDVIALAIAIARRVAKLLGESDSRVLLMNIDEAMKLVVHARDLRITIHPAQQQTLLEALPKLKLSWPNMGHVEIVPDESIAPGGCKLRTAGGTIDADLDAQVDRIARELLVGAQT